MPDFKRAATFEDGVIAGEKGAVFSGDDSPQGNVEIAGAGQSSLYLQTVGQGVHWIKVGPGANDWQVADFGGSDHHSGYYCIPGGQTVRISENKQMRNKNNLKIDGSLQIFGQLILE